MPAFLSQQVIPIPILFWFSAPILIIQHIKISYLSHGLFASNPWFFETCCKASPQNKNVEKLSGQLKFKVTDLQPRLHKVTGQFFNFAEKYFLSYLSIQVLFVVSFKYCFTQVYWDKRNYNTS